jgi:tetratricopeptide (TPR) repeat protein
VIELHREDSSYAQLLNARSWNRGLANADLDQALRDVNTAIRKSDSNPGMLDTRALIQLRRKDYAAAITDASAALDKMPRLAPSLFVRGLARLANGDQAGGQADLAAARAIRPTIDRQYADYGLVAPKAPTSLPAQPQQPGGEDDDQ